MKTLFRLLVLIVLLLAAGAGIWYVKQLKQPAQKQVLTREGVLTQIQNLNRLESTAFHIDTIIKTEKPGNWLRCGRIRKPVCLWPKGKWWPALI